MTNRKIVAVLAVSLAAFVAVSMPIVFGTGSAAATLQTNSELQESTITGESVHPLDQVTLSTSGAYEFELPENANEVTVELYRSKWDDAPDFHNRVVIASQTFDVDEASSSDSYDDVSGRLPSPVAFDDYSLYKDRVENEETVEATEHLTVNTTVHYGDGQTLSKVDHHEVTIQVTRLPSEEAMLNTSSSVGGTVEFSPDEGGD